MARSRLPSQTRHQQKSRFLLVATLQLGRGKVQAAESDPPPTEKPFLVSGNSTAWAWRGPGCRVRPATNKKVHLYTGNLTRARDIYRERMIADPYFPDDPLFYYAQCLSLQGEHKEAVSLAQEYCRRVPGTPYGYTLLATAQGLAGQKDAARETVAALREAHPSGLVQAPKLASKACKSVSRSCAMRGLSERRTRQ